MADRPRTLAARIGEAANAGRLEESVELLEIYVRDRPHRADEQFLLACTLSNLGRINMALTWLKRVVALKPQHSEAQLRLGRGLLRLGHAGQAEGPLRRALALAPGRFKTALALGTCLNRLERWVEAEPFLARACAGRPDDASAHYEFGLSLLIQGRPRDGVRYLTRAAALEPAWVELRLALARAFYELGQIAEALSHAETVAGLNPARFSAWLLLGSIDFARNRLARSCQNFWRAAALYPDLAEGHFLLGRSLAESNLNVEAAAAFAIAAMLESSWADAYQARGAILLRMRQLDDAVASIASAIAAKPQWAVPRFQIANALLDLGSTAAASANYAAAACLDPDGFGRHLAHASLSVTATGPVTSLEAYAKTIDLPTVSLPKDPGGGSSNFACIAVALDRAAVIGSDPLIVAEDGTMLAGGIGYSPYFACDQIRNLDRGWYIRGRDRYVLAAPAAELKAGAHFFIGAYANFGHWLINNVGRLAYIEQHAELRHLLLATPGTISADRRELLALLGYGADRITQISAGVVTRFEKLWVSATLWQQPLRLEEHGMVAAVGRILATLGQRVDPHPEVLDKLIYIPRGRVTRRRVSNESEVMGMLVGQGFEIFDPSLLSTIEQIRRIRQARIIVAPMGAGPVIVVFARPGTTFIECKVESTGMDIMPFLCATIGLGHVTVRCARAHVHASALFDDFDIPTAALDRALKLAISSQGTRS